MRTKASKYATAWGCLKARNFIRAGKSKYEAVEFGVRQLEDVQKKVFYEEKRDD